MTGPDEFERMLHSDRADTSAPPGAPAARRTPVLPVVSTVAALLGVAVLLVAGIVATVPTPATPAAEPAVPPATTAPLPVPRATAPPPASIASLADDHWVQTTATAGSIPPRALAAYAGAALALHTENPACGLGWNTLAAIGHIESEHGTIHGSTLDDTGTARPRIIGIPLDGTGVDAIPDSDAGALDGDTTWDRAVGPMQFIPTTWALFAADGNGDGRSDPQQIDDAALAAGRYLCSATDGSLRDSRHWITAISAYNSTIDYNNRVAASASFYATLG